MKGLLLGLEDRMCWEPCQVVYHLLADSGSHFPPGAGAVVHPRGLARPPRSCYTRRTSCRDGGGGGGYGGGGDS